MERLVFATGPIARAESRKRPRLAFRRTLSSELDLEVVVVVASTYAELSGLIARGHAHVAWLPPAVCVRTCTEHPVEILLRSVRPAGDCFRGALFVKTDSPWQRLEDLRGSRVAWVDYDSCSGYLFPRLTLLDRGIEPESWFAGQYVLGSHDAVIRAVAVDRADVGATFVDGAGQGNGEARYPGWSLSVDASDMRIIAVSDPIPSDTICVLESLPSDLKVRLTEALTTMHTEEAGADVLRGLFGADRFELAEEADYEAVRRAVLAAPHLG